jgi:putative SOS response-associated peptidase YedK
MCGRYYRRSDKQRIAEAYRLGEIPFDLVLPDWNYNVAPTTFQPVIRLRPHPSDKDQGVARVGHPAPGLWRSPGLPPFEQRALEGWGNRLMRSCALPGPQMRGTGGTQLSAKV